VRLQFNEIVEHPDADLILRTLEHCFHDVSLQVIHSEDQLTVYGLGPSFRTMNPNDKTILRATRQQAATLLHAEANFLASALMGDMPQDTVVRSKIEQALQCMKTQLQLDASPRSQAPPDIHLNEPAPPIHIQPSTPAVSISETFAPREPQVLDEVPFESTSQRITMEPVSEPPAIEPEEPVAIEFGDSAADVPSVFAAPTPISSPPPEPLLDPESPPPSLFRPYPPTEAAPAKRKRSIALPLTLLAVFVLSCAAYLLQHRDLLGNLFAPTGSREQAAPIADPPVTTQPSTPSIPNPVAQPSSPAAESIPPAATAGPEDIKVWIEEWAAAMRTRDLEAQVSFYADPVDRYFLTPQVHRDKLLREKQSDIQSRNSIWTFNAENVVIEQHTASSAVVLLTKRITTKSPSSGSTREQRLKTQLKLKLVDGSWKITSERTIGWG
jgi:ketosteroid isomerase-like protein